MNTSTSTMAEFDLFSDAQGRWVCRVAGSEPQVGVQVVRSFPLSAPDEAIPDLQLQFAAVRMRPHGQGLFTPMRSVTVRKVTGMVALELDVLNANTCTLRIFFRKMLGLRPENALRNNSKVTNR